MEFALYQVPTKTYPSVGAMLTFAAVVFAIAFSTWFIQKEAHR